MKKFRKIWDAEKNNFLKATKGLHKLDALATFYAAYPELRGDVTPTAFFNQRSRMGAAGKPSHHFCRTPRPLYSEQVKKGYVRIKIAQPNVWIPKAKWVYMNAHPNEDLSERSNYIFLDGDNRNFAPENIERVPLKIMGQFNLMGGCEPGQPAITKLRVLLAKLKMARFDAGEKLGLVVGRQGKMGRVFRLDRNERARVYNSTPERRKIINARAKARRDKLRKENPAKYEEILAKHRVYMKDYYKKKKGGV